MGIGNPVHLIFLGAIALVVLGPKRLPELARSLGHGIREFRDSMSEAVSGDEPSVPAPVPHQVHLSAVPEPPLAEAAAVAPPVTASQVPAQAPVEPEQPPAEPEQPPAQAS
jgi:TatA/E family protein of Tat protein translocase